MVTSGHTPSVLLCKVRDFHILIYRNNADLGKGVPRQHVFHDAWELLFFPSAFPFFEIAAPDLPECPHILCACFPLEFAGARKKGSGSLFLSGVGAGNAEIVACAMISHPESAP